MKDYYAILGISPDSTGSDIRNAYRRLAKKYHPDVNKSKDAQENFIKISEAYEFLINHWQQQYRKAYADASEEERNYSDYRQSEEYKRFMQDVRERAQQQAKMRYEEFKKQHDAFRKSGIDDIALLIEIIFRIALIPLFFFFLFLPVYLVLNKEWTMIFLALITWPLAGLTGWYIYNRREKYFMPGEFYYSPERIKQMYSEIKPAEQKCYYCASKMADSKSYRIDLLKLKGLILKSSGFRQHNASYINEKATILIPRSRKALIVHSVNAVVKVGLVIFCIVFMDISSLVWKIIIGMVAGGFSSSLILLVTGTKSNVSYLISYGMVFRISIWIFIIVQISQFSFVPFNITTSEFIHFVIVGIIIFDSFLLQLVNVVFGKYSSKPLIRQLAEVEQKFDEGFRVYNDVPVISVIYPLFKWCFG